MAYENILVEQRGKVALVTLNRPQALNALNSALVAELGPDAVHSPLVRPALDAYLKQQMD
jgi:enoyl-CoA hydratase/carnithine racemase